MSTFLFLYSFHFNSAAGDPLYLTPYIQAGDIQTAKDLARVSDPLPQIGTALESYAGFLTVDEAVNANTFFWFFPATVSIITLF